MDKGAERRSIMRMLAIAAAAVLMVIAMSISVHAVNTEFLPNGVDYTTVDEEGNVESKHLDRDQFDIIAIDTPMDNITLQGTSSGDGKWYVVYGGGSIFHRIEVEGKVNLLLMNDTELDCKEGFHVRSNRTLNIYAQGTDIDSWGKLIATGGDGQAAIGANRTINNNNTEVGGTVNIYGGKIEVTGGAGGAGIGGGQGMIPSSGKRYGGSGGEFNLYGGLVTANGGPSGAAIGGGYVGNSGTITIYGGTLEARGGIFGSGIGGGRNMEISAYIENGGSAENITIKGGTIRAYGGKGAAGIGGGAAADGSAGAGYDSEADKKWIKIEAGDVYAEGGEGGAGIGGGIFKYNEYYDHGAGANVMISGGRVTARGGAEAAGIGATRCRLQGSGDTVIKGTAKVTAYGGDYAAGIGTGNEPMAVAGNAKWNKIYNIQISENAEVTAYGGKEAAGIGAGNEGQPSASRGGTLKISGNARVEAYGGKYGAGIGGGDKNNNGKVEISGGTVIATGGEGGAGIGGGDNAGGNAGKVTISGGVVNANGGYKAAGIGGGDTADMKCELEVTGGKVTAKAGEKAAGIGGGNHTVWSGGGNGGTVTVDLADSNGDDYVFAISGNDDSSPVGHGDAGDGLGTFNLATRMSVKASAGDNYDKYDAVNAIRPETFSERVNVCHNGGTSSVLIQHCKHNGAKYTYLNENKHRIRCAYCGQDAEEDHTPSDSEPCTKCNYGGEVWVVTLKEGSTGAYSSTLTVAKTQSTHLPDCDNARIPKGKEFIGWVTSDDNVNNYDFEDLTDDQVTAVKTAMSNAKKAGNEITPASDITYYALYIPEATVSFDPNGGSGSMSPLKTALFTSVTLPTKKASFTPPEGMELDKWTIEGIEGSEYDAEASYLVEQTSVTLKATWKTHTHDFDYEGAHVEAVAPKCDEYGNVEFWRCKTCERFYADEDGTTEIPASEVELSPTGHNWDAPAYTWSDDNSSVTARQVCLNDPEHHYREETASARSHVAKEASCSEEGITNYYAQFNNPVFKMQSKTVNTPKTPHDWSDWEPKPGDDGIDIRTCSVCGATEERGESHVHTLTHHPAEQPGCVNQGKKEYWSCDVCGKLYADENANQRISDEGSLGIPATGHKYVASSSEVIKQATCEEGGVIKVVKKCEKCGGSKEPDIIDTPALGHDWNNGVVTKAATCTESGIKKYTCLNDPSHTRSDSIAALGHDWTEWTSVTDGGIKYKQRECTRCGETQRIADGDSECVHEAETIQGKAATCTDNGLKEHYKCSHCGVYLQKNDDDTYSPVDEDRIEEYLEGLTIDRLGHDWDEPKYSWSADNSSATAALTCKRDAEHKEIETVKTSKVTKPATCDTKGETTYYAEFSNRVFDNQTKVVEIKAKGHSWDAGKVIKQATQTADGVKEYTCKVCGKTKTEVIPKIAPSQSDSKGEDGTPAGKGASEKVIDNAIRNATSDEGPAGTKFAPLKLKSVKQTKKSIKLSWTKVKGTQKYVIYANQCGKTKKMQKLATLTSKSKTKTIKKVAGKKLKKGKYYKFIIVALDKNNKVVSTSKVVHAATKGGKVGNHKSVTVKKAVITKAKKLKKGKTLKLNAKPVKASKSNVKIHRKVSYESSNKAVATVSKNGVVKGVKKGSCYIYAYAQNGVSKRVKVTVK